MQAVPPIIADRDKNVCTGLSALLRCTAVDSSSSLSDLSSYLVELPQTRIHTPAAHLRARFYPLSNAFKIYTFNNTINFRSRNIYNGSLNFHLIICILNTNIRPSIRAIMPLPDWSRDRLSGVKQIWINMVYNNIMPLELISYL